MGFIPSLEIFYLGCLWKELFTVHTVFNPTNSTVTFKSYLSEEHGKKVKGWEMP